MIKRERIINELTVAAQTILTANGFNTNAGKNVFVNRSNVIGETESYPLINIVEFEDRVVSQVGGVIQHLELPISIEAHDECDPLNPSPKGYKLLSDIQKCFSSLKLSRDILSVAYSGKSIAQHENGSAYVGARVKYIVKCIEKTGDPEF